MGDKFFFWIDWFKAKDSTERQRLKLKDQLSDIVTSALKQVLAKYAGKKPDIFYHTFFGAMELDPKNLSIWFFFPKIKDLKEAESNGRTEELRKLTLAELEAAKYPAEALPSIYISFDSDETVQNEADGNYFQYLK